MPSEPLDFSTGQSAARVRSALRLSPHPEGGWYRETWRDVPDNPDQRGALTAILFLLAAGEVSAWHRIDATEIWLWHAGAPLSLDIGQDKRARAVQLGPGHDAGQRLQAVVPALAWQSARSTGDWTLVSCIVAPAFRMEGFELAPSGPWPHRS